MDNTYLESMKSHVLMLESELIQLSDILLERPLNQFEYRAAERTVQISIEASIGVAKHLCKKLNGMAPANAYKAFEMIASNRELDFEIEQWKRIIGMRNALVHDYLNLDSEVILHLIKTRMYQPIIDFCYLGLKQLDIEMKRENSSEKKQLRERERAVAGKDSSEKGKN